MKVAASSFIAFAQSSVSSTTMNTNYQSPSSSQQLSVKDSYILARLFDPESSPSMFNEPTFSETTNLSFTSPSGSKVDLLIDSNCPPDAHIKDLSLLENLKNKEVAAVKLAETGHDVDGGLRLLAQIVDSKEGERYASAWVNQAMCKRLVNSKRSDKDKLSMRRMVDEVGIMSDLQRGISLALGLDMDPDLSTCTSSDDGSDSIFLPIPDGGKVTVSAKQAKVLSQAYTHLGTIYLLLGREKGNDADTKKAEKLEELSSRCFEIGGKLGNEIGRMLAVKTNPYAKLCGVMVKEVMKREFGEER